MLLRIIVNTFLFMHLAYLDHFYHIILLSLSSLEQPNLREESFKWSTQPVCKDLTGIEASFFLPCGVFPYEQSDLDAGFSFITVHSMWIRQAMALNLAFLSPAQVKLPFISFQLEHVCSGGILKIINEQLPTHVWHFLGSGWPWGDKD